MNYEETIHYLYNSVPVFQHSGASAYKPGLKRSHELDEYLGHPHRSYKTIHVAGTNGKGSVCHLLAAILQKSGYKTGLFTSPHLIDFRERIRVNGEMISKEYVVDFVAKHRRKFETVEPSFFELTSSMAFDYFRDQQVDFAIIETGLGGRLDSTNIITPELCIITNVSLDHQQYLGETLVEIAQEKAGIITPHIPVLIGETYEKDVKNVFINTAKQQDAPLYFAPEFDVIEEAALMDTGEWYYTATDFGQLFGQLGGVVQCKNSHTVLAALQLLSFFDNNLKFKKEAVREAFEHVVEITGLRGRWETLEYKPVLIVADTGHNEGAWIYLTKHILREMKRRNHLHMVIGMSDDKDVNTVLDLMPDKATYYYVEASVRRAMSSGVLTVRASEGGKTGYVCDTVREGILLAMKNAKLNDMIFIGGSTFVVADAIEFFSTFQEDENKEPEINETA